MALIRLELRTEDEGPGATHDEFLALFGLDDDGRLALQIFFDIEDMDAAMAELDATHAHFEEEQPEVWRLDNAANGVLERYLSHFPGRDWDAMADLLAADFLSDDRRRVVNGGVHRGRDTEIATVQVIAELGAQA